jgi:hypothetical protein
MLIPRRGKRADSSFAQVSGMGVFDKCWLDTAWLLIFCDSGLAKTSVRDCPESFQNF